MAVTTEYSTEYTNDIATKWTPNNPPDGSKLHFKTVNFTQGVAAGDANSLAYLISLPARATLIGSLSKLYFSAFGAARTLDVGIAGDEDLFCSAVDVSSAGSLTLDEERDTNLAGYYTNASDANVAIIAKCEAATLPAGATIKGVITFAWK